MDPQLKIRIKEEIFRILFKKESQIVLAKLDSFIDTNLTRGCRFIFNSKFYCHSKMLSKTVYTLPPIVDIPDHLLPELTKIISNIDSFTKTEKQLSTYIQKSINSSYTTSELFLVWPNELNLHLQKTFKHCPDNSDFESNLDTSSKEYALINQQLIKNILL